MTDNDPLLRHPRYRLPFFRLKALLEPAPPQGESDIDERLRAVFDAVARAGGVRKRGTWGPTDTPIDLTFQADGEDVEGRIRQAMEAVPTCRIVSVVCVSGIPYAADSHRVALQGPRSVFCLANFLSRC